MNLTTNQSNYINQLFAEMNSKQDFLFLLNRAKELIYKEKTRPFSEKQLNYYISRSANLKGNARYRSFKIPKRSGGERIIHAPSKGMKEFQTVLSIILSTVFTPHENATGFVQGKSIVDNAKNHINQNYVYNIDLKDFFPSIDASRVWARLLIKPFNLGQTEERKRIANMIKAISCTHLEVERYIMDSWETKIIDVLPQGAPTSPIITNFICERLDKRLSGAAKRFGLNYSRYADDITFSSNHNVYRLESGDTEPIFKTGSSFDVEIRRIIKGQNFHINESKVRLQKRGYRQEVTGLIVNDKINVQRRYVKEIRHWLYFWERYGFEQASELFLKKYLVDRGRTKDTKPNFIMVLEGKLLFLKMVKGDLDPTYIKLRERFEALLNPKINNRENKFKDLIDSFILDLIFEKGLDEAMQIYDAKL